MKTNKIFLSLGFLFCANNIFADNIEQLKQEKEILEQNQQDKILLISCILLLLIVLIIVYLQISKRRKNLINKKNNEETIKNLDDEINKLETEISEQNEEYQKVISEATSSIRYAKRIQNATFSQPKEMEALFKEYFIFTKPHSIVTGDFYKAIEIKHYKIFVLADCSGHGVPGGFITMLGLSALKESFSNHFNDDNLDLGNILDEMRIFVKETLRSDSNNEQNINDGMNITICAFDIENNSVRFAGANQNVYLVRGNDLTTYNGDRMPIGWSFKEENPFSETCIPTKNGDMLYILTDSLQNQFGGKDNTKFSIKRITNMLLQIANLPISEQKSFVETTVNEWVEGYEQIDDLSLVGIKL
ncbi:MAG: SpoIIE family protein phosphatase [Bacteroidales bacterium]|nr:SpoIIE family protein phosphatase [Bacteroidales bacterium]